MPDADLRLRAFSLTVHAREFPHSEDFWDGNWLAIEARYECPGTLVTLSGPCLRTDEIERFAIAARKLDAALVGEARLDCLEPYLALSVACDTTGHLRIELELRPDLLHERHIFNFELDQTYLKPLIADLDAILVAYPVRSPPKS